jgi:Uma2 family endonuclease
MSDPARRRATYQDVLNAPSEQIAEVINGELHLSRPRKNHSLVAYSVGAMLAPGFHYGTSGPGGWTFLVEPELHLGDDILVPDVAGWRDQRMPGVDDGPFETHADWVCEVLSPSTEKLDRLDKMSIYAVAGVGHAWLLHPIHRTLEVFRLHGRKWRTIARHQGDQRVHVEPFAAIELDLAMVWFKLITPSSRTDRACEPTATYRPGRSSDAGDTLQALEAWDASEPWETWDGSDSPYEPHIPEAHGSY